MLLMYDAFESPRDWRRPPFHGVNGGVAVEDGPQEGTSALVAIDPATQRQVWRVPTPTGVGGGVLATAGNLVFQGSFDNRFTAYDAQTGRRLWAFDTKAPTIAPPITYVAGGKQSVTVLTGSGGSLVLSGDAFREHPVGYRQQARRVLTFRLGGRPELPEQPQYRFQPIQDDSYKSRPDSELRGLVIYSQTCIMCHGREAVAFGGAAPDLRESPAIADPQTFAAVVRGGSLRRQGMPSFADLSDGMIDDLRQYLRMRARQRPNSF